MNRSTHANVAGFVALALGIAWVPAIVGTLASAGDPPYVVFLGFGVAPGVAALVVAGNTGRRDLMARCRVSPRWWVPSMVVAAVWYAAVTHGIEAIADQSSRTWPSGALWASAISATPIVILGAFMEELGWRGYLLPALQARMSALGASIIIGAVWGIWHLPLALQTGTPNELLPLWWYPLAALTFAIPYTAICNSARGSVIPTTVFHGVLNVLNGPFVQHAYDHRTSLLTPSVVSVLVNIAITLVAVQLLGATNLSRRPRTQLQP